MTEERSFSDLIARAGHELRSPLTSIKGFSSTLVKRWDRFSDDQRLQFVETIHADSERMSRIVSEILDLARVDAGRLELQLGPVDLTVSLKMVLERLENRHELGRVSLDVADELSVWTDRERFERGLENLIENALKFSEGPVGIAATSHGKEVSLTVRDDGRGIEPERLPHVFAGPGPRGQKAATGSGLGLALFQRVLSSQGARIDAHSELGAGTVFTVTLPTTGLGPR